MKVTQENYKRMSEHVNELEGELTEINEKLGQATSKIDDTGKAFSDSAPL